MANHGGTVSAQGRVGEGTTFTVHLPSVPPPDAERAEDDGPPGADPVPPAEPDTANLDLGPEDDRDRPMKGFSPLSAPVGATGGAILKNLTGGSQRRLIPRGHSDGHEHRPLRRLRPR